MSECSSAHKTRLTRTTVSGTILCDEQMSTMSTCSFAHKARLGPMARSAFFVRGSPDTTAEKLISLCIHKCIHFRIRMFLPF